MQKKIVSGIHSCLQAAAELHAGSSSTASRSTGRWQGSSRRGLVSAPDRQHGLYMRA